MDVFTCPICMDTKKITDIGMVVAKCSHRYCMDCFMTNIQYSSKCALCREELGSAITNEKRSLPSFNARQANDVIRVHWQQYLKRILDTVDLDIENKKIRDDAIAQVLWNTGIDMCLDTAGWYRHKF